MATREQKVAEAQEAIAYVPEEMTPEEEYDLLSGFLKAAENIKEVTKKIEVRDGDTLLFAFRVHALTADDVYAARKKASKTMPNPKNKKLKTVYDFDQKEYESYLIYLATTAEDRQRVWDNAALKNKFNVMEGHELIDCVFATGFKQRVIEVIDALSGFGEDVEEQDDVETAKNS